MRALYTLFLFLIVTISFAQVMPPREFYTNPKVIPNSPEAGSLFKISDLPLDYTSGAANIQIPLCNISIGKINVPITINYSTGGIKVQDIASMVGLGWSLDYGGIITVQDEAATQFRFANAPVKTQGQALPVKNHYDYLWKIANGYAQKENPIYYFKCGKLSGYFFYDIDGNIQTCSDNEGLKIVNVTGGLTVPNSFKITSDEGLEYLFNIPELSSVQGNSVPSALLLAQITDLSSGRKVVFKYVSKPTYSIYVDNYSQYYTYYKVYAQNTCEWPDYNTFASRTATLMSTLQIDSILYDGGYTKFDASSDRLDMDKVRITGIRQYALNGFKINDIKFKQSYFYNSENSYGESSNYRLKLDSIIFPEQTAAETKYAFEYNTAVLLPPYRIAHPAVNYLDNAVSVDYWGFYNGKYNNKGLIPTEIAIAQGFNPSPIYSNNWGDRNSDSNYTSANILKKIIYPTNGYTLFQYENNQVDSSMFGKVVGGLRVKNISYFDQPNAISPSSRRSFKYLKGFLLSAIDFFPFTYEKIKGSHQCGSSGADGLVTLYYTKTISGEPLGSFAYNNNVPVFYKEVEEYRTNNGKDNGKTFYDFDYTSPLYAGCLIKEYGNRYLIDNKWEQGQLARQIDYKSLNGSYVAVQKTINEYTKFKTAMPKMGLHVSKNDVGVGCYDLVGSGGEYFYSTWIDAYSQYYFAFFDAYKYIGSKKLTRSITTLYTEAADSIVNQTDYYYDNPSYLQATRIKQTRSRNDHEVTFLAYPPDYADMSGFIKSMKDANYLASPIEVVKYRDDGNNQTIISGNVSIYEATSSAFKRQDLVLENESPVPIANFKFSNRAAGQAYPSGISSAFSIDPRYKQVLSYDTYDNFGNLTSFHQNNNVQETFIWGYKGLYPVAKIIGTDYNTAIQYVNLSVLNSPATTETQMRTELNKLRINLPTAMVSTYTYAPMVGISSETDPSGKTIFYEYDKGNRLKLIRDQDGKILKQITYQYQQPIN
ncbi:hypothetical protein [Chitinophaga sp. MM2321]|uniref:hypothetical protein n=1 Tax=Chitinophaga sp. MM2321 TaxID=3137178 RepID=UPI0032D579B7